MGNPNETERYQKAAYAALEQLDWCVEYLRRIRKTEISDRVAKNRASIARRLPAGSEHSRSRT
jgi:hypothetical protein